MWGSSPRQICTTAYPFFRRIIWYALVATAPTKKLVRFYLKTAGICRYIKRFQHLHAKIFQEPDLPRHAGQDLPGIAPHQRRNQKMFSLKNMELLLDCFMQNDFSNGILMRTREKEKCATFVSETLLQNEMHACNRKLGN